MKLKKQQFTEFLEYIDHLSEQELTSLYEDNEDITITLNHHSVDIPFCPESADALVNLLSTINNLTKENN